jgi:DNA primase
MAIRKFNFAIIVEGQMDMLMAQQAGWENAIATSGTALTENHLAILKRATENIVIAYDNDKAGVKASGRAFEIALRAGFNVKACRIEEGKDPADLILKDAELFKKAIKESEPVISFFWKNLLSENLSKEKLLSRFRQEIVPLLSAERKNSERQRVISELGIASKLGLREDLLIEEISKIKVEDGVSAKEQPILKISTLNERIFGLLFAISNGSIKNESDVDIEKELKERSFNKFDEIMELCLKDKDRLQFEAEVFWGDGKIEKNDLIELLENFEEDCLKDKLNYDMQRLTLAEKEKSKDTNDILKEIRDLTQKLSKIRDKTNNKNL